MADSQLFRNTQTFSTVGNHRVGGGSGGGGALVEGRPGLDMNTDITDVSTCPDTYMLTP